MSSTRTPGTATSSDDSRQRRTPVPVPVPITDTAIASAELVGLGGGHVEAGAFRVDVPAGALDAPVVIQVIDYSGVTGRMECELLPHGLQFKLPVRLKVDLPPNAKDVTQVYWIKDQGLASESWEALPTEVENKSCLKAYLNHFSRYAPGSTDGKAGWSIRPNRGGVHREELDQ